MVTNGICLSPYVVNGAGLPLNLVINTIFIVVIKLTISPLYSTQNYFKTRKLIQIKLCIFPKGTLNISYYLYK